jgi:putative oxidoreductase
VNLPRSAHARDAALLLARLLLGTIMLAHGHQKLLVEGLGRTSQGFEHMSIPWAIVSASFVTVVEVVGGALLVAGLLTTVVAALMGVVMAGAAAYVHVPHGIFVTDGGWELVGAIGAALTVLAVAGPGRWSAEHLLRVRRDRAEQHRAVDPPPGLATDPGRDVPAAPVPPAGLPFVPLIRLDAGADPVPLRRR